MSETLAHYTTLDAMLNIIKKDGLHFRATHYTKLNDSLEFKWSYEELKEKAKEKENLTEKQVQDFYEKFPYVISLSEEKDDHLMWHLYGKCGYGVSMVLNRDMLKKDEISQIKDFNSKGDWHVLLNVKYANENNRLSKLAELEKDYNNNDYGSVNEDMDDVFICCAFLKHEDWKREREVRYAVIRRTILHASYNPDSEDKCDFYANENSRNVMYYARGCEFIPYLDVCIPPEALTAIVIGNRLDFEKTRDGIKKALNEFGANYDNVEIIKSEKIF